MWFPDAKVTNTASNYSMFPKSEDSAVNHYIYINMHAGQPDVTILGQSMTPSNPFQTI